MKAESWKFILAVHTTLREQNFVTRVCSECASAPNFIAFQLPQRKGNFTHNLVVK